MPSYRHEASSEHGLIQQLACSYANRGYRFYFANRIPDGKNLAAIDEKLINAYRVTGSKTERWRRKKAGQANVQYIRYGREFFLLATHGEHEFFRCNEGRVRDLTTHPLKFYGYSVSIKGGHCVVRIAKDQHKLLKASLQAVALKKSAEAMGRTIDALPFERYRGVLKQLFQLVKAVNAVRGPAGLPKVPNSCIRVKRRVVKPFVDAPHTTPMPYSEAPTAGAQRVLGVEAGSRTFETHSY